MLLLPGYNTIHLCPAAIMRIVEEHLRRNTLCTTREEAVLRVTGISYNDGEFILSVTTDPQKGN